VEDIAHGFKAHATFPGESGGAGRAPAVVFALTAKEIIRDATVAGPACLPVHILVRVPRLGGELLDDASYDDETRTNGESSKYYAGQARRRHCRGHQRMVLGLTTRVVRWRGSGLAALVFRTQSSTSMSSPVTRTS